MFGQISALQFGDVSQLDPGTLVIDELVGNEDVS